MNSFVFALACSLVFAGCAAFYLASPHQRWRATSLSPRPARAFAAALALAGLYAFTRALDVVPAVFAFLSSAMLLFVTFPYVGALIAARRGR